MKTLDLIAYLQKNEQSDLFGKDFLLTWEKSKTDLKRIVLIAEILRSMREKNISPKVFDSGLAVSIFRDNSTRTRFSYASAANLLGLAVSDMDETKSQIAHGETLRETATMISFLSEIIGIRDDMYPGLGNSYMRDFGKALDEAYHEKILMNRPSIVNLQCDLDHPTQSISDLCHLRDQFGSFDALKGKKIVMSWAYSPSYGKPMSVPQGVSSLMSRFEMDVVLAHPPGYELLPEVMNEIKKNAQSSGRKFEVSNNMDEALTGADIVYPKSWAPLHIMHERTKLIQNGDSNGLKKLEQEGLAYNKKYIDWEYDAKKSAKTKNGNALYMHCLPADISGVSCSQGEVSAEVFEKFRLRTYKEASWKPYVIASMMLSSKYKNPEKILADLILKNKAITF